MHLIFCLRVTLYIYIMCVDASLVQYAKLRFKLSHRIDEEVLNQFGPVVRHASFDTFLNQECVLNSLHTCIVCDELHVMVVTEEFEKLLDLMALPIEMPLLVLQCNNDSALSKSKSVRLARDVTYPYILASSAQLLVMI